MTFKKKKISQKKINTFKKQYINSVQKNRLLGVFFGIISISLIFFGALKSLEYIDKNDFGFLNFNLGSTVVNTNNDNSNIKNNNIDHIENILLLGHGGGDHEAPLLTDTIILAKINYSKQNISMLSIPRDFYVEYDEDNSYKINELYMRSYYETGDKDSAIEKIIDKITQITGEKIDKYIRVDFNGFIKIVDTLGGIKITLDNNFIDNRYPDNNRGYTTFILKKGTWVLDGEVALKFARSRHSTSDFDRSLRQQQIINAIKDKVLSLGFLSSPSKIKEFYNVVTENLDTNLSLNNIINILISTKDFSNNIYSSNLNDTCYYGSDECSKGGFLYVPLRVDFNNLSVLLPFGSDKLNLNNYSEIHKYVDLIFNFPEIYKEFFKINIYNSTKTSGIASSLSFLLKQYGFNIPLYNSVGNIYGDIHEKTTIYYNNIDENSITMQALSKFIFGPKIKLDSPKYSKDLDTKIEIVLGNDYKFMINN